MNIDINQLPDDPAALKHIISTQHQKLTEKNHALTEKDHVIAEKKRANTILTEEVKLLRYKLFGSKSEKLSEEDAKQGLLFNEAEQEVDEGVNQDAARDDAETVVKEHTRSKKGRKPLPEDLKRVEVIHDLPDNERACGSCESERPAIGYDTREELVIEPPKIYVLRHKYAKYGPCNCEASQESEEPEIITTPREPRLLPRTIASPGLLAYIVTAKFCDALPFYRQEKMYKRYGLGAGLSRSNMCNWMIAIYSKYQFFLNNLMAEIRSGPLIQLDETPFLVLDEPGKPKSSKSYMWVTVGYPDGKPLVMYHYYDSRRKEVPLQLLDDYQGYIQTDDYAGYNEVGKSDGIIHVGCFAHARRYFNDAVKVSKNAKMARVGISFIKSLYKAEKILRKQLADDMITKEMFVELRKLEVEPVFNNFHVWLSKKMDSVLPTGKLGQAIKYTYKNWPKLIRYIDAWFLTPDNNISENAIRPFVMGRNYAELSIMRSKQKRGYFRYFQLPAA